MKTQFTDRTSMVDGLPPVLRRPDFWAKTLSEGMDLLTYAALFITTEVHAWPFLVAAGLGILRLALKLRLKTIWIVTGFLLQIFLGIELVLRSQLHPLIAAAHIAPLSMAWIGLTRGGEDLWGWRMGLGFIGLILASALSPDFSVMLMILGFVISGSIGLSCRFLTHEFVRRGVVGSLPPGFIRTSFYQTGVLLVVALIIFPLIPRVQGKGGGVLGSDPAKAGYSEDVNLSEWTRVSSQGSSATALRIYGPNGDDPNRYIPNGLLRSRVLSILEGNHWNPAPSRPEIATQAADSKGTASLMIVREMIGPANLPVPYGTRDVAVELYGSRWGAERTNFSEWREARSRNQRFNYWVTVDSESLKNSVDAPRSFESLVPESFQTPRLKALAAKLFAGKKSPDSKISSVFNYFKLEKFRASYAEDDTGAVPDNEVKKLPPIERFLFVEKSGHCELFASSVAILLRMGGVPTRLIAGFRVSRNSVGDVLTVRQADGHAWLEAYLPNRGWVALDPTPKISMRPSVSDWLRDTYDWASAKWTQYILNYGEGDNSLAAQWEKIKKMRSQIASGQNPLKGMDSDANVYLFVVIFLLGSVGLSISAIVVFRRVFRKASGFTLDAIKSELVRERKRMDRICSRIGAQNPPGSDVTNSVKDWYTYYERARFGASDHGEIDVLVEIRRRRNEIEATLKQAS